MTHGAAGLSPGGSEAPTTSNPRADESGLPSVSVVIPTHDRPELLRRCLDGVVRQDVRPLEVIVVDNTPGETATREAALAAGARYIVEPATGLSFARNRGARESAGDIVAYLDDDAIPESDWLAALIPEFLDPLVGAVAGRIIGLTADAAAETVNFGGSETIVFDCGSQDWFERANFGGIGQGTNMAIRRSTLDTWGGFDERLGRGTRVGKLGMEEHYAFFSLIDRGFRIAYTPRARVRHPFPQTAAALRARHLRQLRSASFHLALLLVEEPRYRRLTGRYAFEAVRGKRRGWRAEMSPPAFEIRSWERGAAGFAGLALYVLARLRTGRAWRGTSSASSAAQT